MQTIADVSHVIEHGKALHCPMKAGNKTVHIAVEITGTKTVMLNGLSTPLQSPSNNQTHPSTCTAPITAQLAVNENKPVRLKEPFCSPSTPCRFRQGEYNDTRSHTTPPMLNHLQLDNHLNALYLVDLAAALLFDQILQLIFPLRAKTDLFLH